MSYFMILVYVLFGVLTKLDAGRILAVFPTPSISHQVVFRPLTQELARRGHEVVVITTDPAFPKGKTPANLTEIDVHDISYKKWGEELEKVVVGTENDMDGQLKMFLYLFMKMVEKQVRSKEVNDLITNKKMHFDLILVEACVRPALIYSHIFKAPVIQVSSFGTMVGTNNIVGAPNHPFYQPSVVRQRIYNLSFWEKIREIYRHYNFEYINYQYSHTENVELRKIFGPDTPGVYELLNNVDMVFLNSHPIWNDNSPVPPNVIYMGGIHQLPAKDLPQIMNPLALEVVATVFQDPECMMISHPLPMCEIFLQSDKNNYDKYYYYYVRHFLFTLIYVHFWDKDIPYSFPSILTPYNIFNRIYSF